VIAARLRERYGLDVSSMHADDGIVLRLPDTDTEPPGAELAAFEPEEIEGLITAELGGSALFASRFRECAARALLLPKRDPRRRSPLWQQRQRAAALLQVASDYGSFPVVLETMRECLQDVFDVPGLVELMRDLQSHRVRLLDVETPQASPFAQSLLFGYIGAFLYEGDTPLAERRAQALTLDTGLLSELMGQAELRELLDPDAVTDVELELQRLTEQRAAFDLDSTADLLRIVGDLATPEALARGARPDWLAELEATRRAIRVRIAGEERWITIEDAGRVRDALGVALPVGVPETFTEPVRDAVGDVVGRYARTHGPFHAIDCARRLGLGISVVETALHRLAGGGRVLSGEFRPGGSGTEWCDAEVLRMLRRRSLAKLRGEVEPVSPQALARFLPAWQNVGLHSRRGFDALARAVEQLAGAAVPASALETVVLPSRVEDYSPAMLDELMVSGEVRWAGHGSLPGHDGWIVLAPAEVAGLLLPAPETAESPLQQAILAALDGDAALFFRSLSDRVYADTTLGPPDDAELTTALWELVWAGQLSGDTLSPLRAVLGGSPRRRTPPPRGRYGRPGRPRLPSRTGPPVVAGRWSRLPDRVADSTRRTHAMAEALLDRHGLLTRGAVAAEQVPGGFSAVYRVLRAFEESGHARQGYFVAGLGAAQFGTVGAIDRLRTYSGDKPSAQPQRALVLAASDPANPYGGALGWPDRPVRGDAEDGKPGHRPGRKAGALVVLVDGELAIYVERGGRSLLSWSDDPEVLQPAADALALAVRDGVLGRLAVERADGVGVLDSPLAQALEAAGFRATPRGLRMRA
jgi:ATP-dependent Lhr-like helicase